MAASKTKKRAEPEPDEDDMGQLNWFVLHCIAGYWRAYIDDKGEQVFTRCWALQIKRFLDENPAGWTKVELAEARR